MDAKIIDGKSIADQLNLELRAEVKDLEPQPGLAAILIGDDPASQLYVNLKKKACELAGLEFHRYFFEGFEEDKIIEAIEYLNHDESIHGILVQLPLPKELNTDRIIAAIDPTKDVEGFHPVNLEKLKQGAPAILSPLVLGIQRLIEETKIEVKDKKITILGNHEHLLLPFKFLYGKNNEVVNVTPDDADFKTICHEADILIVAVGRPRFVKNNFIKKDAIVIDVGINNVRGQTVGDVDFEEILLKASFISPVPGGVGPMTIAYLLRNTVKLFNAQTKK